MGLQRVRHDWVTFTFTHNQRFCLWFLYVPPNCVYLLGRFSRVRLWDPIDCSPSVSSVHGISQVRILEWVAMLSSKGSSQPWDRTQVSHIAGQFFTIWVTTDWKRKRRWCPQSQIQKAIEGSGSRGWDRVRRARHLPSVQNLKEVARNSVIKIININVIFIKRKFYLNNPW